MWELHRNIGSLVEEKDLLIDTVSDLMGHLSSYQFSRSLTILYEQKWKEKNPVEIITLFIRGLKFNNFFEFNAFIKGLKNGRS